MHKTSLSRKEKRMQKIKSILLRVALYLFGLLLAVILGILFVQYFGMQTVIIDQSMNPLMQNEDVVLVNRLPQVIGKPKRMDVVAIKIGTSENSPTYVRRIIGLPGETVRITDGKIFINDEEIEITFNDEQIEDAGVAETGITLDDDEYFVLCDDYNNSRDDGRLDSIGTIDSEQIIGKVWFRISPMSRLGLIR